MKGFLYSSVSICIFVGQALGCRAAPNVLYTCPVRRLSLAVIAFHSRLVMFYYWIYVDTEGEVHGVLMDALHALHCAPISIGAVIESFLFVEAT